MNEKLNLVEILKDCPTGTKLYSTVFGEVEFDHYDKSSVEYPIFIRLENLAGRESITAEGKLFANYDGECILFPSREQRDWSKFKQNKERFDPKTLKPFDKVLVRDSGAYSRRCAFYSHTKENDSQFRYVTENSAYEYCIPYNNDTKHLIGKTENAPEFYRYWED
jgi:hypothetical protein